MTFSIVLPVYKTERFLPRCLDSLMSQTDGDFEVVVVDDCSPGDGAEGAGAPFLAEEAVAQRDSRFRSVRHERNRSAFQARCTGVMVARGDYVVPVDPDDYLLPETLAKLRETIERDNPDLISYRMEYDDGRKTWPHWCCHGDATVSGREALRELTERRYFTGVASKAFRRETLVAALRELNAPNDLYVNTCDDFLMLLPMLMKCEKVSFLDFIGYRYFVNEKSTSFSWKSEEGFRRACEQTHRVGALVLRMAGREHVASDVRLLIETAVLGIERWFVQMAAEGSDDGWERLSPVVMDTLLPRAVAEELVCQLTRVRQSRACRIGRMLTRAKERFMSFGGLWALRAR